MKRVGYYCCGGKLVKIDASGQKTRKRVFRIEMCPVCHEEHLVNALTRPVIPIEDPPKKPVVITVA